MKAHLVTIDNRDTKEQRLSVRAMQDSEIREEHHIADLHLPRELVGHFCGVDLDCLDVGISRSYKAGIRT